jgi:hypothetical protein
MRFTTEYQQEPPYYQESQYGFPQINWRTIVFTNKLSEDFIRYYARDINFSDVSTVQQLSESFIREFQDKVNWSSISKYQKLSESFIRKFQDNVEWIYISKYQKLSEDFIKEFKNKVCWFHIFKYQKLSDNFIDEFNAEFHVNEYSLSLPTKSWLYQSGDYKLSKIKECKLYEIDGDYVIAYKGTQKNHYSVYNFQYQYEVGETYETHADYNLDNENSFGFSAWTEEEAENYCNERVVQVKIHKDDLAALVHKGNKIRCQKLTVVKEMIKKEV